MATTSFAQHELVRIAYEMSGEGDRVVIILHGLLSDRVAMRPLADELAEDMRVIVVDLRGHGGSSAIHGVDLQLGDLVGDVIAVLDDADVTGPISVVGLEIGVVIADALQSAAPHRVASVIPINEPQSLLNNRENLLAIADRAYKGQTGPAVDQWLTLSWGEGWESTLPRARVAAARRSAAALPQMLHVLANASLGHTSEIRVSGGTPFADDGDVERIAREIRTMGS